MPYAVITRDVEGSAPYAAALEPLGLEVITMPVTRTELPDDPNELIRAMEAGGYQAIVCASARAAGAVIRAKGHAPVPEVWCVGPATARVLADAHIPPIVPDGTRDGASLAHALVAERDLVGKRVLVPRAEDGRDEVITILREAGVLVDDIVAYRTVPTAADDPELARGRALFEAGGVAICVVFAPSQATALAQLFGVRDTQPFAAIGETTAAALRELGAAIIAVAHSPTPEGIAGAVASVYPVKP